MNAKLWFRFILMGLMISTLVLAGCEGDDGDDGNDGSPGVAGTDGTDGADGSDVSVQDLADLGLVFADDVTAMNITLDLSRTVSLDSATGALTIHFFLTDEDDNGIDVLALPYELRFYVSELIPDIPNVADNPGPAFNQLFNERGTPAVDDRVRAQRAAVAAEDDWVPYFVVERVTIQHLDAKLDSEILGCPRERPVVNKEKQRAAAPDPVNQCLQFAFGERRAECVGLLLGCRWKCIRNHDHVGRREPRRGDGLPKRRYLVAVGTQ